MEALVMESSERNVLLLVNGQPAAARLPKNVMIIDEDDIQ